VGKYLLFYPVLFGVLIPLAERLILTDGGGHNSVTEPEVFILDAALHKIRLHTDRQCALLRFAAFDVTNHQNSADGSPVGSAGKITETSSLSRQIEIAVKGAS
jgi:hypothetical protein